MLVGADTRQEAVHLREAVQRHTHLQEGDQWYVLSIRWWDLWKKYTDYDDDGIQAVIRRTSSRRLGGVATGGRPPPIDNESLVLRPDSDRLQRGLQENTDFILLHQEAWNILFSSYGGGPTVQRGVIAAGGCEGTAKQLRVELYPLWLTIYRCDLGGFPDLESANELTFSRSAKVRQLLDGVCDIWGIADTSEENVRLWHRGDVEVDQTDVDTLEGWDELRPTDKALEDSRVVDGTSLLLEESRTTERTAVREWPFFHRIRLDYKKQNFKDPRTSMLTLDDVIDASVTTEKQVYSYMAFRYEKQVVESWYEATIVEEDEGRVLVQFHNREAPKVKLPPILTTGSMFSSKQLTDEAKAGLGKVFQRFASGDKITKGGMRGLLSCATNSVIGEYSGVLLTALSKYGDGQSVDLEGFERYWLDRARSRNYWFEKELLRLFERAGASLGESEEERLLAEGREWIPRTSSRLAQYRTHDYAAAGRGFREFRKLSRLDANFAGEWKPAEVLEANWETMAVLVQTRDAGSSLNPRFKAQRDWIPMESEWLAEFETRSLEALDSDTDPARLLARSRSQGGVCEQPGMCGLKNLGNTCFLNATLQCLSNCVELRGFFGGHGGQAPPFLDQLSSSPFSMEGRLAREFSSCICQLWGNSLTCYAPARLKSLIGERRPEFSGYQQQDAQELLIFLLDGLHEEVNRAPYPRPTVPAVEANGRPDADVAAEAWEAHLQRNDSAVVRMFQFQLRSEVRCPVCDTTSVSFDPTMCLSLPVPKPPHAVELRVLPGGFPHEPMMQLSILIDKDARFSALEYALWQRLGRSPAARPSCFVFADIWGDRVIKIYQDEDFIKTIRSCDCVSAVEVDLVRDLPEERHTFVPVLFRKQQPSLYACTSRFSYSRIAPPRIIAVADGHTNGDVHKALSDMAEGLLGLAEAAGDFDVVRDVDAYGNEAGTTLSQDDLKFEARAQQHVGINFQDGAAVTKLQERLRESRGDGAAPCGAAAAGGGGTTLQYCLEKHAEREQLSDHDSVYCSKCQEHRCSWKKLDMWSLPQHLLVHLKRFGREHITGPLEKLTTAVEVPQTLDLAPIAGATGPCTYELYGVVNHSGGLSGGHYTAHALVTPADDDGSLSSLGEWYRFNDQHVSKGSSQDIDPKAAYILFYRRKGKTRVFL